MPKKLSGKKDSFMNLRGMKDILPSEQRYWDFIFNRVQRLARDYGFQRIETPVLESASLFTRSVGTETDIVSKEMYMFVDQGGDKVALRPEGTAGVARSYIEHGMLNQPQPVKLFYYSPMFRHDRPQAGRQRQFWQFGFEIIGEQNAVTDAQLITMSYKFYADLGLSVQVEINSVGCQQCRPGYLKALSAYLKNVKKDLCEDCQVRMLKNPLRVLDCKEKQCQE
jgi:histidyl-tRNA synthetase